MPSDGTAMPENGLGLQASPRRATALILGRSCTPTRLTAVLEVWADALCAQVDPDLFFPERGQPAADAKLVCAACPVRAACLTAFGDLAHGVVGGLSVEERRTSRSTGAAA
jgi:hypothetical protein